MDQKVILDTNYIKVTYLGVDKSIRGIVKICLQVDNKSNQDLRIITENVSVDYDMEYALFKADVAIGKSVVDGIMLCDNPVTTNLNTIQGKFEIMDNNFKILDIEHFSIQCKDK